MTFEVWVAIAFTAIGGGIGAFFGVYFELGKRNRVIQDQRLTDAHVAMRRMREKELSIVTTKQLEDECKRRGMVIDIWHKRSSLYVSLVPEHVFTRKEN